MRHTLLATDRSIVENFAYCELNQGRKLRRSQQRTMSKVKRADGASPRFSRATRLRLDPEVVGAIKEANWMDMELHKLASELAKGFIAREAAKGPLPVCSTAGCSVFF